ncbi:E3 ubiquitin-protein ligase SH3RF3-like isoform X2 [Ornithodoros turicata]|uniref:E3 ubiquitin-protein ligase SH3RF3-like isoform X2 n=1 Tax=Ornithodoros turicata TaxID=34597 RepID=UPI003139A634
MDEAFLTDLLECSVCLEQLDSTSKVLPCQHTFCKRCLDEIVNSHKELRCPECRILVDCRVEDLPLNILLIRLLEGIKNNPRLGGGGRSPGSGGVRQPSSPQAPPATNTAQPSPAGDQTLMGVRTLVKQLAPPLPCAKALYAYEAKDPGDLTFRKGEVIVLRKRIDQNWFHGELGGKQGFVPASYVQVVVPLPSHVPQCKALYDFRLGGGNPGGGGDNDEKDCLAFLKGDVITVIRRVDENWAEGKLNDRIGIFPISFVEMNAAGKALMKLSTNAQVGPSRIAPPTPSAETSGNAPPAPVNTPSGESQSSTASPESSSPSPGTPSSSSPPLPACQAPREKRHSLSALSSGGARSPQAPHRHSMEILSNSGTDTPSPPQASPSRIPAPSAKTSTEGVSSSRVVRRHSGRREHENISVTTQSLQTAPASEINPAPLAPVQQGTTHVPVPNLYLALYNYKPQKEDELELRKNELYTVTEKCQDGWFKGTSLRTGLSGVFPGNYVQPTKAAGSQYHLGGIAAAAVPVSRIPAPMSPRPRSTAPFGPGLPHALQPMDSFQRPPCGVDWGLDPQRPTQRPPNPTGPSPMGHKPPMQVLAPKVAVSAVPSLEVGGGPTPAAPSGVPHMGNQWMLAYAASTWAPPSSSCTTPTRSPPQGLQTTTVLTCSPSSSGTAQRGDKVGDVRSVLCHQKERREKDKLSLMKRLTSKRRSRSPPPVANFSCDNPTFVDAAAMPQQGGGSAASLAVVHVRSGSCPSEVLGSQQASHKKSNSLDGNDTMKTRPKQPAPLVRERFRCIVPYPPNSEYELELKQGDIVYVHKKRDDGWYKGTLQRTGKTGLFPGSFVEGF